MERRDARRFEKRLLARIWCRGKSSLTFIRNLSATGLFVIAHEVFPTGSLIRIEIDGWLSGVRLKGRVVWSRRIPPHLFPAFGGGMGIRLIEAGTPDYRTLLTPNSH